VSSQVWASTSVFSPPPQHAAAEGDFDSLARRATEALRSDPKQAESLYSAALKLKPTWAEGWFYLGAALYKENKFSDSRAAFLRASELAPENGAVWGFLGLCESRLGDYANALQHIHKGEEVGLPDDPAFFSVVKNEAAVLCLRSHNFGGALAELRVLAKQGDRSPATVTTFGVVVLGMPYLPADIAADKRPLIELAGHAAVAFYADRDDDQSTPLFKQLLERYPNESGVHYFYGISLLKRDPKEAVEEFRRELEITPSHVGARQQIAILEIKSGNTTEAANLAREALKIQPDNPLSHAVLGRAYEYQGELEKAAFEFVTAVKLAPNNPQLHFALARIYQRTGNQAAADKETAEYKRLKALYDRENTGSIENTLIGDRQ